MTEPTSELIPVRFRQPVRLLRRETDAPCTDEPSAEPDLDVDSILTVHRYPDGYIGFVRKVQTPRIGKDGRPYQFENLFSIRTSELQNMLPGIAGFLLQDSYFTVNAYYRPAHWQNRTTGLPDVARKEKYLSRLLAAFVDIDSGRTDSDNADERLDVPTAIYRVLYAQEYETIPPASILARSGRGIYCFWLLVNPGDRTGFQSAFAEKVQLYKAINRELGERLHAVAALPVDLKAFDAARVLRVPGSVHTGAQRRVTYWTQLNSLGRPFVYTLGQLRGFLQLDTPDLDLPDTARQLVNQLYLPPHYRRTKHPGTSPNRIAGRLKLYAQRAEDLLLVLQHRRGILKRGMRWPDAQVSPGRRFTLSVLADFLHWCDTPIAAALETLHQVAETARPAYPSADDIPVGDLVTDAYRQKKKRRWSNAKLCRLYGIDADMARKLDLQTILPAEVKAERDANRTTRWQRRQDATEYLREYIEANQHWPSNRDAAAVLTDAGHPVSHETARKILRTLHLSCPSLGHVHVSTR